MRLDMPHPKKHTLKVSCMIAGIAIMLTCVALIVAGAYMRFSASPHAQGTPQVVNTQSGEAGWPNVDWEYWQDINPDVCAWITVPGTSIDFPVVQASKDAPTYYLKHDIYNNWNIWGVPYLDAENAVRGMLSSKVSWIYGHNMLDGTMFEPLVDYADQDFMDTHPKVWIQTPSGIMRSYDVYAAEVLKGTELVKRCDYKDEADYRSWRDIRYTASATARLDPTRASRILCLVTCSHNTWKNERTIVYCMPSRDARDDTKRKDNAYGIELEVAPST